MLQVRELRSPRLTRRQRGLKEMRLCERLDSILDLAKPDYELLPLISEEAERSGLPRSKQLAARILMRLKRRRFINSNY